jgi:hypothetical protein
VRYRTLQCHFRACHKGERRTIFVNTRFERVGWSEIRRGIGKLRKCPEQERRTHPAFFRANAELCKGDNEQYRATRPPNFLVEGAIRRVWEVDDEFFRPSHDVVLRRDSGSYCVKPIRATDLIRVFDDDVVQPSNESRRTAPPRESAADHAIHVGEGTAAPSSHSPMIGRMYRVSHSPSVQ